MFYNVESKNSYYKFLKYIGTLYLLIKTIFVNEFDKVLNIWLLFGNDNDSKLLVN